MEVLNKFCEENYFLNGFSEAPVYYNYRNYVCAESAYYAQKTLDGDLRAELESMTGEKAYEYSRSFEVREHWNFLKKTEMYNVTWCKFTQNEHLKNLLLETGDKFLIDVNTYDDKFWGICDGKGENLRGFILMNIRSRLDLIESQGYESYYDITNSEFYELLCDWGIDFEFTATDCKEEIVRRFIDAYGYNELLLMMLPILVEDNIEGEWEEDIDYISQLEPGDY